MDSALSRCPGRIWIRWIVRTVRLFRGGRNRKMDPLVPGRNIFSIRLKNKMSLKLATKLTNAEKDIL